MSRIKAFIDEAIKIAKDESHGYSQNNRWGPDYDCSSLVYHCATVAGYDLPKSGTRYTGTIIEHFTKAGWRVDPFDGNLYDLDPGDLLLNVTNHVAIYIGNNQLVEASCDENGGITGPKHGDQTGKEIRIGPVYNYPWEYVLTAPAESSSDFNNKSDLIMLLKKALEIAEAL